MSRKPGFFPPSGGIIGQRPCASHPTLKDEEERRPVKKKVL